MSTIPQWSCEKFIAETFSSAPVPGGGGTAALTGAIGAALAGMVGSLTTGKKKYAQYEADIQRILAEAQVLTDALLAQVDKDAENFAPLAACYRLPSGTEEEKAEKETRMQAALKVAVSAPMEILRLAHRALLLQAELTEKGSKLAVSDAGCGAVLLKAAMQSAWLNVMINLKSIHDPAFIDAAEQELKPLLADGERLADEIYENVKGQLAY